MGKSTRKKSKAKAESLGIDDKSNGKYGEDRFIAAETRPQFKVPKTSSSKVVLDDRFSSVLTDSRFQLQEKDKYGRKKKKKSGQTASKKELESFYVIENQKENSDRDDENSDHEKDYSESGEESDSEPSVSEKAVDHVSRIAYLTAISRGEADVSSSSEDDGSSESSDDDDDSDGDLIDSTPGILDPSTRENEEIEISYDLSPYLVVTNMDWENIRAVDLFCILSSFGPPGAIKRVQIFQSDFGMQQMAKDKLHGPTGIWKEKKTIRNDVDDSSDEESGNEVELDFEPNVSNESDFDPEKLRAYEASKLKYYFAVTEVSQPEYADIIYKEVDGMEFEHSSTAIDLRTLPTEALESVITDRPLRDEATSIPGKYEPPDFIVSALQQTNVQCTWDQGDKEREKKLTNYGSSNWQENFEKDDLKAYLASDGSSDDESDEENNKKASKKSMMRKALGLDSDSDESDHDSGGNSSRSSVESNSRDSGVNNDDGIEEDSDENSTMSKQLVIIPGKKSLEEKIRSKFESKEETKELTPWEKYKEKRKQKRKERRQAARGKRDNDFFASDDDTGIDEKTGPKNKRKDLKVKTLSNDREAKEQLELLLAKEHAEEDTRDYDIRGIQRIEKNKGKKFKGSRKRKEAKIVADVSGTNFKINVNDDRFKAVLDGGDERFGIDKTNPNFKDTTSMREILNEQSKRRKNKRQKNTHNTSNTNTENPSKRGNTVNEGKTSGASALSFLVQKLKSQVDKPRS